MRHLIDVLFYYCVAVMLAGALFQFIKARGGGCGCFRGADRKWFYSVIEIIGILNPFLLGIALIQIAATIKALFILPFAPTKIVRISLPNDRLVVVNGGNKWGENHSLVEISQIWALDLAAIAGGRSFRSIEGPTAVLSDFYSYGLPLVSPVNGTVLRVRNDARDRGFLMGCIWPFVRSIWGNYLEIRSVDGYRILFAHLQSGSIRVKAGDQVDKGTFLGLIGNSGLSSEPHLHIQCHSRAGRYFGSPIKIEFL